jgi:hypothetical protein
MARAHWPFLQQDEARARDAGNRVAEPHQDQEGKDDPDATPAWADLGLVSVVDPGRVAEGTLAQLAKSQERIRMEQPHKLSEHKRLSRVYGAFFFPSLWGRRR